MIKYTPQQKSSIYGNEDTLFEYIDYLESCKRRPTFDQEEDLIFLPDHKSDLPKLDNYLKQFSDIGYDFIIFVGIGGANLGVQTIYDALMPEKEVIFFENIDPDQNSRLLGFVRKKYDSGQKALMITASKSGATTETMSNFTYVLNTFQEIETEWKERSIVTTVEGSNLDKIAKRLSLKIIYTHELLVDRYSVFGLGSLFALTACGVDTALLLNGAKEINEKLLLKDFTGNPALNLAMNLFTQAEKGENIYNSFIFSSNLSTFGRWYRQLLAESLGKEGKGITPIYSVGTVDLHSMTQLYLDGPKNVFTTFISLDNFENNEVCDPQNYLENTEMSKISNKTHSELMAIVFNAVKKAYTKQELSFNEITLPKLDAFHIGQLLQIGMLTTIFLGKLMNVNPFNQDAVELYKEEIRNQL
ncbi:hypothetical protein KC675_04815 [Candidatus Dojkabacteria bacterium]|uniref:Glucose-6-phosphate isomerase n=1 Tax=Candidatus Dojkabacteria bacterium TaxID=2099670 RepID=A0A955IEH9_9BACT|nr:hypothetical protein [Candidatus Dojkabacteria bacterium]